MFKDFTSDDIKGILSILFGENVPDIFLQEDKVIPSVIFIILCHNTYKKYKKK
jgi:hypothetical protein